MTALAIVVIVACSVGLFAILYAVEQARPEPTRGQVIVNDEPVKPEHRPPDGQPLPPVVVPDLPD